MKVAKGLETAIKKAGGVRALARLLGINASAISRWTEVPARHIISIERLTGVPREVLRPDLYPPRE
jgi:DNA-binding transcriptional regulator YdaS (Cro superfamily)